MFPITMFWFAWSGNYNSVHVSHYDSSIFDAIFYMLTPKQWIVPVLAGVFLSTSILLIFVAYLNYLTDSYIMFAASALAANTVCRSAAGAAAPLFTQYMFDALGVGGGGSLIGGVACILAPIPFVFYKYGGPIRKRSKFAPTADKESKEKVKIPGDRQDGVVAPGSSSSSITTVTHHSDSETETGNGGPRIDDPRVAIEKELPDRDLQDDGAEIDLEKGKFE